MDLTLIPICSVKDHDLKYNYKIGYICEICNKSDISYCCINCEYGRCSKCHRDILASEEIKERLILAKLKNDIKLAELKLIQDKFNEWKVMVSDGKIIYVNKTLSTYSYNYPRNLKFSPSPKKESYDNDNDDHVRCTFTEILNTIKSFF